MSNDENCFPVIGGNGEMGWTSKSNYKVPVLSIGRVGALCGNVHLINYQSWISDNSLILKVHSKKIGLKILKYILLARDLNILASKSAQPLITGTQVKNEKIVLPPLKEQDLIVEFIKTENLRINNLTEKQKALIEKLKEYRASIISHAVTGKIDVRELVA
ncbi:restriction endonuclease subunit S [Escherichia coli]